MTKALTIFFIIASSVVASARPEKSFSSAGSAQERPRISSEMYQQLLSGQHNESMIRKAVMAFNTTSWSLRVGESHDMSSPTIENIPNGDIVQHMVYIPLISRYEYTASACVNVLLEEGIVYQVRYLEARPGCGQ